MNAISILTQELAEQFSCIVGRALTASEYMEIRNQAMKEVAAGYTVQTDTTKMIRTESVPTALTSSASLTSVKEPVISEPVINVNKEQNQSILFKEQTNIESINPSVTVPISNKSELKPQINLATVADISTPSPSNNSDDDFFALVGKFSQ